jgi:hypothetical protein
MQWNEQDYLHQYNGHTIQWPNIKGLKTKQWSTKDRKQKLDQL